MNDVSQDVIAIRKNMKARFQLAFREFPDVFERIGDLLHFFGPAQNERDIALQNAFKSVLHEGGFWGDSDDDRANIFRKLTGVNMPQRSLWRKIIGR